MIDMSRCYTNNLFNSRITNILKLLQIFFYFPLSLVCYNRFVAPMGHPCLVLCYRYEAPMGHRRLVLCYRYEAPMGHYCSVLC